MNSRFRRLLFPYSNSRSAAANHDHAQIAHTLLYGNWSLVNSLLAANCTATTGLNRTQQSVPSFIYIFSRQFEVRSCSTDLFNLITMEQSTKVWIILGSVLGLLVLLSLTVGLLCCWQRNKRKVRGFSLRAVTPLDDAEFESWRRPKQQYTQRSEKYPIRTVQPTVTRDRISPTMFEKELHTFDVPRTPSPTDLPRALNSPKDSIRKPERVRRKSSVASSIADRPPTPYSPTSPSGEFTRVSTSSRKSQPLIHYPSVSETSAFRFDLEAAYGTQNKEYGRWI